MWVEVQYKEELALNDKVRVARTKHEAVISKVVVEDEYAQEIHCKCYHIEPRDPKDLGGHWYFSHDFERLSE